MFQNLKVFSTAHALARHAGAGQAVVARNIAHADTPGYRARTLAPFAQTLAAAQAPRATRPGHLLGARDDAARVIERPDAQRDLSGNTVSLETEMLEAVQIKRQHDRALAIYKTSLDILRLSLGRR